MATGLILPFSFAKKQMKLASRRQRILGILLGIALLVIVVVQIWRDGRRLQLKRTDIQSITK
jgi:hypothetical protein